MLIELEAACRAVCDCCRRGMVPMVDGEGDWYHPRMYLCAADALRKLAAEQGITTAGAAVGVLVKAMDEEGARDG